MTVATTTALPLKSYASDTYPGVGASLPAWVTTVHFSVARCTSADPTIWPNAATTVTVTCFTSFDNGVTWTQAGGFSGSGGIVVIKGVERATMENEISVPLGNNRQFRADVVIDNGPLFSKADITLIG
jgi:hypothetical protein